MIIIYKAANITEAHIVAGMLESAGIETHVGGHYLQGGVGEIAAMDFANVQIDESDVERARALIVDYENTASENEDMTQPIDVPGAEGNRESSKTKSLLLVLALTTIAVVIVASLATTG